MINSGKYKEDSMEIRQLNEQIEQQKLSNRNIGFESGLQGLKNINTAQIGSMLGAQGAPEEIIKVNAQIKELTMNMQEAARTTGDFNDESVKQYKVQIDNLELQKQRLVSYEKEKQALEFQGSMISKRIEIFRNLGLPFAAAQMMGEEIGNLQKQAGNIQKDVQNPNLSPTQRQESAKLLQDKQAQIAQTLNVQRRTLGEQFAESIIGGASGTYLNPGAVSGFASQGSGYYQGISQSRMKGGTYSGQLQALGEAAGIEGLNERSPWEGVVQQLLGNINDILKQGLTVQGVIDINKNGQAEVQLFNVPK